ncbi:MAG: glycosyltransferase family 39 protein [Planctomycetota bacterium]
MTAAATQPAAGHSGSSASPTRSTPERVAARPGLSSRLVVLGSLIVLMLVGGLLRLVHLAELTLQVDEGFQALAVAAILDHGFPLLDSGYVYGRSPLFLYAQAGVAALFGLSEWSLRVPSAAFGVLGIPIAYLLGRRLFDGVLPRKPFDAAVAVGLVLAAFMALSAWQIEYARYARFYTLFQCLYMLGLIAFHAGWVRHKAWGKLLFVPVFVMTVSVHDLGVMLGLCFWAVLPLRNVAWKTKGLHFVLSGLCGVVWVLYNKCWRGLQSTWASAWPDTVNDGTLDIVVDSANPIAWALARFASMFPGLNAPDLSVYLELWDTHTWVPTVLLIPALAATLALSTRKLREKKMEPHRIPEPTGRLWLPLMLTAVWTAALHQFALSAVALLIYATVHVRSWRRWLRPAELVTLLSIGVMFVGWVGYFWLSDWPRKTWLPAISNVPGVHRYFLQWFVPGWPRMLVLMVPAAWVVAHFAVKALRTGRDEASENHVRAPEQLNGAWLLLVSIVAPILVTAELRWQFSESRYFLHLYPMILGVLAVGVVGVGLVAVKRVPQMRFAGLAGTLAALVFTVGFTKDLNPASSWDVAARTHDSVKDPIRSTLNWSFYATWSRDQASVSAAAADQIEDADAIAVVGPAHVAANYAWYLPRVDAVIAPAEAYNTAKRNDAGQYVDLVSGGRVIGDTAALWDLARTVEARGGRLWLFSDAVMTQDRNWYLSNAEPNLKTAVAALMNDPLFTGRDGKTTASVSAMPADRLADALPETFDPEFDQHAPLESDAVPTNPDAGTTTAGLPIETTDNTEATP